MGCRMPRIDYTRAEVISDGVVHAAGLVLAIGAVPALIVLTVMANGDGQVVGAASIYGATLILMILFSALYNMIAAPRWQALLQRLDHSCIYLKIAGTYTPFAVLAGVPFAFLSGIWGAALAGVSLKLISPARFRWPGLALYLGMGWVGMAFAWAEFSALPPAVLVLMALGGSLYTVGVAFYLWDRLPFHNTIWHVFVLTASVLFYAAVMVAVLVA